MDPTKIQMSSKNSSNKVFQDGSGTFNVAALGGIGESAYTELIPHNLGTDRILFQVSTSTDTAGTSAQTTLPYQSNDGRVTLYAYVDSTNLYIVRINSDSGGGGFPATTVSYSYRLLIP